MNISTSFEGAAARHPQRPALIFAGRTIRYAALRNQAQAAGLALREAGVGPGDRVALILPNTPAFPAAYYGTLRLGAVVVSIHYQSKPEELALVLADCQPAAVVCTAEIRELIKPSPDASPAWFIVDEQDPFAWTGGRDRRSAGALPIAARAPSDPAAILYTSGTTGSSKGVVLSHGNIAFDASAHAACCQLSAIDRVLLFLPLYHCFGQNAVMNNTLMEGGCIILQPRFMLADAVQAIAEQGTTVVFGVPTLYAALFEGLTPADVRSVRLWFSAAAPLKSGLAAAWEEKFGRPIVQGYGLTETSPFAAFNDRTPRHDGCIGRSIDGVEIRVVSETGEDVGPGAVGEFAVRGPNVMLGYWNRPEDTAQVIRDGWFFTGDLGIRDDDGTLRLVDRKKDMINVGGRKVLPSEVEKALATHPAVIDVAVVGIPDEVMGEQVLAQVVAREEVEITAGELRHHAAQHLAAYKLPTRIHFVGEIARNRTGKVLKRVIRDSYRTLAAAPVARNRRRFSAEEIDRWITDWIAERTGYPAINRTTLLIEQGVTSAMSIELAGDLSRWLERPLSATTVWNHPTIEALAKALSS